MKFKFFLNFQADGSDLYVKKKEKKRKIILIKRLEILFFF